MSELVFTVMGHEIRTCPDALARRTGGDVPVMGPSHAACGAAAWVAITADYTLELAEHSIPIGFGVLPVGDDGVLTGALICAGAALLPDIDHPGGTVARALPPFSGWLSRIIARLSGGHRRGTHSALGLVLFTALAWLAQNASLPVGDGVRWLLARIDGTPPPARAVDTLPGQVWPLAAVLSMLLIAFAVKVLGFVPDRISRVNWPVAVVLGLVVAAHPPDHPWWFVLAVSLGCAVHIAGDMITTQGVHLLWPLRPRLPLPSRLYRGRSFLRLPLLGNAGSGAEIAVVTPVSVFAAVGLGCAAAAWGGVSPG